MIIDVVYVTLNSDISYCTTVNGELRHQRFGFSHCGSAWQPDDEVSLPQNTVKYTYRELYNVMGLRTDRSSDLKVIVVF